jgi:hypothetical protein
LSSNLGDHVGLVPLAVLWRIGELRRAPSTLDAAEMMKESVVERERDLVGWQRRACSACELHELGERLLLGRNRSRLDRHPRTVYSGV